MTDRDQAEAELRNWGRCMNDSWLEHHLMHRPPPTSEHYRAPVNAFDEPEPARPAIDELEAQRTTDIVVLIGMNHIDAYRVLVRWYCHILMMPDLTQAEGIKRLARFMHTSYPGAVRMLEEAISIYCRYRLQYRRENCRITSGAVRPE